MSTDLLLIFSSAFLGVFFGTQITEAMLFVPYWKALKPDDFFEFYKKYGKAIYKFYAPITILATFVPLFYFFIDWYETSHTDLVKILMALCCIGFFVSFPLFFKKANQEFYERLIPENQLAQKLEIWNKWHWFRIFFEGLAFACSLYLILEKF